MINLSALTDPPNTQISEKLLQDGSWEQATFYKLDTGSQYWNSSILVSLPKQFATSEMAALIYLLQKEAHQLSLWKKEWDDLSPSLDQFMNAVLAWGRFSNTQGRNITIDHFWTAYSSMLEGITSDPNFEFSKDQHPAVYAELFKKEDLVQVICFDDTWNEQNYLVETSTHWVLYNWSGGT